MNHEKVEQIYREFVENGVLEDRLEYDIEDLQAGHPDLTGAEVRYLWALVHDEDIIELSAKDQMDIRAHQTSSDACRLIRNREARFKGLITDEHLGTWEYAMCYVDGPNIATVNMNEIPADLQRQFMKDLEALCKRFGVEPNDSANLIEVVKWFKADYNMGMLDCDGWF